MLGLKNNESPGIKYIEEDQREANEIGEIRTSRMGAGDYHGRTDEATNTNGTADSDICGRTDETTSGTDSRVSSSGHIRGCSRYAENPMLLRTTGAALRQN